MDNNHRFSRYSLLLIPLGILINILGVRLALHFELPLFLDTIGTIFAAVLGGYLPGIVVGFLSNVINGFSDPITMYYGILSIFIAVVAAYVSYRGWFRSAFKTILAALIFAIIGGAMGSLITWMLYGFSFGSGISAPFAVILYESGGMSKFMAQFAADMGIDLADKLLSAFIVFFAIKPLPQPHISQMRYYGYHLKNTSAGERDERQHFRRFSLRSKIVFLIVFTAVLLGTLATFISTILYKDTVTDKHIQTATGIVELMIREIDADKVNGYLASNLEDENYLITEARLANIRDSLSEINYMYVYQIREDGCHVVFDIDTPDLPGEQLGHLIPYEDDFLPYREALLNGEEIDPIINNGIYGWLLTVYRPMFDSQGRCVAYAAADVSMNDVITDRYIFTIKMISLLFGMALFIVAVALWFAERQLVAPINAMTEAADKFAYDSEAERLNTTVRLQKMKIKTGDEIESLYQALSKTALDVAQYIGDINDKANTITQMQNNIILSFATMVENRDLNTGQHINHTAAYVRLIVEELRRRGEYSDILTPQYIEEIVRSAPLHDIGKIEISDSILNKPGKLTDEEFDKMKTHTTAGREILMQTIEHIGEQDYLSAALDMAAYHHERWDGTGYPAGLVADNIPLCARIMAVADVFDALISKRSYKEPYDLQTALSIIRSESGSHFDPVVVDAFFAVIDEVTALSKE